MRTWSAWAGVVVSLVLTSLAWAGPRLPKVLLVAADGGLSSVRDPLFNTGLFSAVDVFDAASGTPTAEQLRSYDAVLLWANIQFADANALGDRLADYVDAGGGVVQGMFATNLNPSFANAVLRGRWLSGGYNAIILGNGTAASGAASLGTLTENELIFEGVQSFSDGTAYRPLSTTVCASCAVLGKWSDNRFFAVVDNNRPGRVDLGFFPPDSLAPGGIKVMANSLLRSMRPRVLLVHAVPDASWVADVSNKIRATGLIGITDAVNASTSTPVLSTFKQYDAVLAFSDVPWQNPVALGNVMADYADWGGGVVTTQFNYYANFSPNVLLQGRWTSGNYGLIVPAGDVRTPLSIGTRQYPNHPILAGVDTFSANVPYAPRGAVTSDGLRIADWTNGSPLVVVSRSRANRVDLGMYPPSSSVIASFWDASTKGGRLMANALVYSVKPYVATVRADDDPYAADYRTKLNSTRRFSAVDDVDVRASTPNAGTLAPYGAVLVTSNFPFPNPTALGDTLVQYLNSGRGVVVTQFAYLSPTYSLGGAWTSYYMLQPQGAYAGSAVGLGAIPLANHPVSSFVRSLSATVGFRAIGGLNTGRVAARWNDGAPLAVVSNHRKQVDLNLYPASSGININFWNQRTDGSRLMANALTWAAGKPPCIGDLNNDGQVDDIDFVLFAQAYDLYVSGDGDFDGNGLTDDVDFVLFAQSYDRFECP